MLDHALAKAKQVIERAKQEDYERHGETQLEVIERPTIQSLDSPHHLVTSHYTLPFDLLPFQARDLNKLGPCPRTGLYWEAGVGKTVEGVAFALYRFITGEAQRAVVIMPPIILDQWARFLGSIPGLTVQIYRGTPTQRKKIKLGDALFTLVGIQIFKQDYERFANEFASETYVILDEAHSIKNVSSDNHRKYSNFVVDKSHTLMTGTPISSPEDVYAYVKLVSPGVYRNKTQFLRLHAGERDFWNKIISWKNLDLLEENLAMNTSRVLRTDVLKDLPELTFTPMPYQLAPAHLRLYNKLAEEQLLILENEDGKIDATSSNALYHALGQIILNYGHFYGDDSKKAVGLEIVDQVLDEIGPDGKLVVFATYRMSNRLLLQEFKDKYGAVAAFGDQGVKQNQESVGIFVENPECRLLIAQPTSAGVGIDGLQTVCRDGLFLELPSLRDFQQALARLHRGGQRNAVNIRLATALNTLQVRQQENLLNNDSLVNRVIRNVTDLRAAIYGQ